MTEEVTTMPGLLRVAGWERYPWLRAGFSTRLGGASGVYGDRVQNLGWTREDDPALVAANRSAFVQAVGEGSVLELVTVQQVHGATVRDMDAEAPPLMTADGKALREGDGMTTATAGRFVAILTADCVPVLLADRRTHAVGAFHAGWRGTLAGIVLKGVAAMRERYGSQPEEMIAAIGPCIQACCFEVGAEVRAAFEQSGLESEGLFAGNAAGRLHMNLAEANRRQLVQAGLSTADIQMTAECTSCSRVPGEDTRRFFSYRAEQGRTGRMLSGIAAIA